MEKEELKKKLNETVSKIKSNSKDAKFADSLIDTLLSIKGQMMIKPTELHIETEEIIYRLPFNDKFGSYEIIQFNDGYIFATKGYRIVVRPYAMRGNDEIASSLFMHLKVIIELAKEKDNKKEYFDLSDTLDSLLFGVSAICCNPLMSYVDDEFMADSINAHFKNMIRLYKKAEAEVQDEDKTRDLEYQDRMIAVDEMKKEMTGKDK